MHALVGARHNFCNVMLFKFSPCVPVVKRVDPTLTDKEAKIGHSKFLDIVDSYDVFHHARFIVNFNRETYGIVKNLQIINTFYIDMFLLHIYVYNPHGHRFTT